MARYDFGGTLADFVVTSRHLGGVDVIALSAATLTFWDSQTGGTRYTDLVLNGSAASSIAVGTSGQVPTFQGPDSVTAMWADGGSGRVRIAGLVPAAAYSGSGGGGVATPLNLAPYARNPDLLVTGGVTRNTNGAATSAPVTWPDGTPGTYSSLVLSAAFPGAVDSYKITYGSPVTKTYTQPTITRDPSTGAATNVPAIAVS